MLSNSAGRRRTALAPCLSALAALALLAVLAAPAAAAARPVVLVFGDSLSWHYRMAPEQGWVGLLRKRLEERGLRYEVVNASVSRETAAAGRARVEKVIAAHRPTVFLLALGVNDGFKGRPPAEIKADLSAMLRAARSQGAIPVLAGMRLPAGYDEDYRRAFDKVFVDTAAELRVPLVPFLLEGVAGRREYHPWDAIHPNAAAQPLILENVWGQLGPLLKPQPS